MDKYKAIYAQNKKVILTIVAAIVVGVGVVFGVNYHNNSIVNQAKVEFTGYNGHGYAQITNYETIYNQMAEKLLKKEGIKSNIAKNLTSSDFDTSMLSYDDQTKIKNVQSELSSMVLEIKGSNEDLKNGDKVTVTFKNYNSDVPFRDGSKTFTVKGLKKTAKLDSKSVFSKLKIKSIGVNGKGQIAISSKNDKLISSTIKIKNNGKLSNGDKVAIKLPNKAFKDDSGKHEFTGSHTFNYTVSGLIDAKTVKNADGVQDATDTVMADYVKDRGSDDKPFDYKFVSLYATAYDDSINEYGSYEDESSITNSVVISDVRTSNNSTKNHLSIVAIYTVTDPDDDVDPENVAVQVKNLTIQDGKLNIDDKKITSGQNISSFDDSIKTYERNLNVTGLKLK